MKKAFVYRCPDCRKLVKSRFKFVAKLPRAPRPCCGKYGGFWYVLFYDTDEPIFIDLTARVSP